MHIELIRNHERLCPILGGPGYLSPSGPSVTLADVQEAYRDALQKRATVTGSFVVKVDRSAPTGRRRQTDGGCSSLTVNAG